MSLLILSVRLIFLEPYVMYFSINSRASVTVSEKTTITHDGVSRLVGRTFVSLDARDVYLYRVYCLLRNNCYQRNHDLKHVCEENILY